MSDEIEHANVITLTRDAAGMWTAAIGPPALGLSRVGPRPVDALVNLALACQWELWPFDETWNPAPHD